MSHRKALVFSNMQVRERKKEREREREKHRESSLPWITKSQNCDWLWLSLPPHSICQKQVTKSNPHLRERVFSSTCYRKGNQRICGYTGWGKGRCATVPCIFTPSLSLLYTPAIATAGSSHRCHLTAPPLSCASYLSLSVPRFSDTGHLSEPLWLLTYVQSGIIRELMPQWATIDQWKENHCYQVLISFVSQKGNSGTQSLLLHTRLRHNQVKLFLLETSSTMCSGVGFPSLPVSHCLVCCSSSLGFFL